jgi:hypothetical protein
MLDRMMNLTESPSIPTIALTHADLDLGLDEIQSELLDRMAAGQSVLAAARATYVSRRTAWRRLAAVRAHFGVSTNREALRVYRAVRSHTLAA